jgi:hypothetical protein
MWLTIGNTAEGKNSSDRALFTDRSIQQLPIDNGYSGTIAYAWRLEFCVRMWDDALNLQLTFVRSAWHVRLP